MFSQGDPGLSRSPGGLGIGLALARGVVEAHGGTIEAHSEGLHKGSRFTVYLPVSTKAPGDLPETREPTRSVVPPHNGRARRGRQMPTLDYGARRDEPR